MLPRALDATQKELKGYSYENWMYTPGYSDATQKELKVQDLGDELDVLLRYGCNSERIESERVEVDQPPPRQVMQLRKN